MCDAKHDRDMTLEVQNNNMLKNIGQSNDGIGEAVLPTTKTMHAPCFKGLAGEKCLILGHICINNKIIIVFKNLLK